MIKFRFLFDVLELYFIVTKTLLFKGFRLLAVGVPLSRISYTHLIELKLAVIHIIKSIYLSVYGEIISISFVMNLFTRKKISIVCLSYQYKAIT